MNSIETKRQYEFMEKHELLPHNKVRVTYSDGSRYEGNWERDKRNGHGKLIYPDGTVFEGEFADDAPVTDGE